MTGFFVTNFIDGNIENSSVNQMQFSFLILTYLLTPVTPHEGT